MCGIIGYVGTKDSVGFLIEGLKKLEYCGYDSAAMAVVQDGSMHRVRAMGKVAELEKATLLSKMNGNCGIGHTRWATYGKQSEENAHPYTDCSGEIVVVHNGIIENFLTLREKLKTLGHKFHSETDTEVIAHLIEENLKHIHGLKEEEALLRAVLKTNNELHGAFAYSVLWARTPKQIIGVKNQSPLVVGLGKDENFLATDVPAFLKYTNKVLFLEDGETVVLTEKDVKLYGIDGQEAKVKTTKISWDQKTLEKSGYPHFMLKEIYEQSQGVEDTLRAAKENFGRILGLKTEDLRKIRNVYLVGCGTAYHAAMLGKYYLENFAGVTASVDLSSEFKYRTIPPAKDTLCIAVSQSGETADTLGAVKKAQELGFKRLAICNVLGSALTRACNSVFFTHCGPEISVASTKSFTSQIISLYVLAVFLGHASGNISQKMFDRLVKELMAMPRAVMETLKIEYAVRHLTKKVYKSNRFIFLGRNVDYPIALEGALKLKEISYLPAEGFAAGEIKHGPISIIDKATPVIVLMPKNHLFDKMLSACQECRARGAFVIALTTPDGETEAASVSDKQIIVPRTSEYLQPILDVIALQLFAYWVAKRLGHDIDHPRNLAKSVTVE